MEADGFVMLGDDDVGDREQDDDATRSGSAEPRSSACCQGIVRDERAREIEQEKRRQEDVRMSNICIFMLAAGVFLVAVVTTNRQ